MKAFAFACIFAICIAASMQETPFVPCDDGPKPQSLRVEGCNSSPCILYKGTNMSAQWDFIAIADAKLLKPHVRVTIMGVTIEYPFPEQDACKSLTNGKCPLNKGDKATYNLKMPIDESYPKVDDMRISFSLDDEKNNSHVCFELNVQVTDK